MQQAVEAGRLAFALFVEADNDGHAIYSGADAGAGYSAPGWHGWN
jgi:hypothetical protein